MDQIAHPLNPQQRQAVMHVGAPLLVLAGAGTGKTRVLIHRLAHLIESRRVSPSQIIAVTFTNKAASEMRDRLEALIPDSTGLWLGTFHGMGLRLIRERHKEFGLNADLSVIDTDDQLRLLNDVIMDADEDISKHPPRRVARAIDRWKNHGFSPAAVPTDDPHSGNGLYVVLYRQYQRRLKQLQLVDFGDLILKPLELLRSNARIRLQYQNRFAHVLVDEAQDMNRAQYALLKLIAPTQDNLCLVGDDDQSIYSWRGAEVSQLLDFKKDYPTATIVRLEQNYRSTPLILSVANAIISQNQHRHEKNLWTANSEGLALQVQTFTDERLEADHAAIVCALDPANSAILVRTSAQIPPLEQSLKDAGVPYRVVGAQSLYERKEVKDALAYFRLIYNQKDDLALQRIINLPSRGIGPATLRKLRRYARHHNLTLEEAARDSTADGTITGKACIGIQMFLAVIDDCRPQLASLTMSQMLDFALDISGYAKLLATGTTPPDITRRENIATLMASLTHYTDPQAYIENIVMGTTAATDDDSPKVTISTIHAAKGLEFDTVYLPGMDQGLLPHKHALENHDPLAFEEERRLAYVAVTRAKHRLFISHATFRRIYGQYLPFHRSSFLADAKIDSA